MKMQLKFAYSEIPRVVLEHVSFFFFMFPIQAIMQLLFFHITVEQAITHSRVRTKVLKYPFMMRYILHCNSPNR